VLKILRYSAIILLIFTIGIQAQTIGGSLFMGVPQKDFKEKNDNLGFGFQLQGSLTSPGVTNPILVGLSVGFMVFSSEDKEYTTSTGFFDFTQNLNLSSNMANIHLYLQLAPFPGPVKPYVEILGGGNYLFTTATVDLVGIDQAPLFESDVSKDDSFSDFTWSYGAGAGILISIVPLPEMDLYLDLKARYLKGGEAEFVTQEDIDVNFDKGQVYFSPRKAKTDLISFHIGATVAF
jgi:hypothetical protein